jgi:hypothetical protein
MSLDWLTTPPTTAKVQKLRKQIQSQQEADVDVNDTHCCGVVMINTEATRRTCQTCDRVVQLDYDPNRTRTEYHQQRFCIAGSPSQQKFHDGLKPNTGEARHPDSAIHAITVELENYNTVARNAGKSTLPVEVIRLVALRFVEFQRKETNKHQTVRADHKRTILNALTTTACVELNCRRFSRECSEFFNLSRATCSKGFTHLSEITSQLEETSAKAPVSCIPACIDRLGIRENPGIEGVKAAAIALATELYEYVPHCQANTREIGSLFIVMNLPRLDAADDAQLPFSISLDDFAGKVHLGSPTIKKFCASAQKFAKRVEALLASHGLASLAERSVLKTVHKRPNRSAKRA